MRPAAQVMHERIPAAWAAQPTRTALLTCTVLSRTRWPDDVFYARPSDFFLPLNNAHVSAKKKQDKDQWSDSRDSRVRRLPLWHQQLNGVPEVSAVPLNNAVEPWRASRGWWE